MKSKVIAVAFVAALVAACDAYPKDPDETTRRVRGSGTMRTGIVSGDQDGNNAALELAGTIAGAAGAQLQSKQGSAEILIRELDDGKLDLVVGKFAKSTPWKTHAALSAPYVAERPKSDEPVLRALVKAGENRWLMFVGETIEEHRK